MKVNTNPNPEPHRLISGQRVRLPLTLMAVASMVVAVFLPLTAANASSKYTLKYFQSRVVAESKIPTYQGPKTAAKPPTGKKITVIECAAANTGCVSVANGIQTAGNAVGWTTTIMDGGGSSATTNQDMITAINAGTNGILLDAIDSSTVLQGMEAAKAANVPVISAIADSPVGTAPSDVYAEISGQTVQSGVDLADLFIVAGKGKAKVAAFHVASIASTVNRYKGFKAEMKKCSGCKIVSDQTYGLVSQSAFISLIKATLAAHPTIQYIFIDISQYATLAAQALQQLGMQHKVGVAGVDCLAPETQSIAHLTGEVGCAEDAIQYAGGPVVNEFTRAFAGLPSLSESVPLRLLTRQIITSGQPPYLGGFDLLAHYESLWGLG